jgi:hypothetical protein
MLNRRTFLMGTLLLSAGKNSRAQQITPQIVNTSSVIPDKLLKGPNYELAPRLSLTAHHYQFQIITTWGVLPANGLNQLRVRLYEMECLKLAMDERWQPQSIQGAFDSLEKTPEGALMILRDPIGTIIRTPQGLKKLVEQRFNEADRRAGGSTRRELAAKLGCDPETSNPLLSRMLDEISTRSRVGKIAARIGMSVAVPGLGLLALNTDIKKNVTAYLPSEINESLNKQLHKSGVAKGIREQFLSNLSFTTTEKLYFIEYLKMLDGVPVRFSLIENAAAATNETQSLAVLEEAAHLVTLHRRDALTEIRFVGLTSCKRKQGPQIVIASVDYLSPTADVGRMAKVIKQNTPNQSVELHVMGQCSPQAQEFLAQSNITVKDNLREPFSVPGLKEDLPSPNKAD